MIAMMDLTTPTNRVLTKHFYRIGDASEILGVKPYVLGYWETEFSILSPSKSSTGHRVYTRKDIETLQLIKQLLYNEKYSIEGARLRIRELKLQKNRKKQSPSDTQPMVEKQNSDSLVLDTNPISARLNVTQERFGSSGIRTKTVELRNWIETESRSLFRY